jgi:hypothetical protein
MFMESMATCAWNTHMGWDRPKQWRYREDIGAVSAELENALILADQLAPPLAERSCLIQNPASW